MSLTRCATVETIAVSFFPLNQLKVGTVMLSRTHGHFMQTWLTVEEYEIAIFEMSFHNPAVLQERVCPFVVSQVYPVSRVSRDKSGAWVFVRTVSHKLLKVGDVVWGDSFGIGQVSRYTVRYADLVEIQIGVTGNDGTSGEIDTLAHQISSQSSFFTLESRSDRLDRPSTLLQRLGLTRQIVVHVGRDVVLEESFELVDDVSRCTFLLETPHILISLDDVG